MGKKIFKNGFETLDLPPDFEVIGTEIKGENGIVKEVPPELINGIAYFSDDVVTIGGNIFSNPNIIDANCDRFRFFNIGDPYPRYYPAFRNRNDLLGVEIGKNVTVIGDKAFQSCRNLKEIHLGKNVTHIGKYNFDCCPNIELVIFDGTLDDLRNIEVDNEDHRYLLSLTNQGARISLLDETGQTIDLFPDTSSYIDQSKCR